MRRTCVKVNYGEYLSRDASTVTNTASDRLGTDMIRAEKRRWLGEMRGTTPGQERAISHTVMEDSPSGLSCDREKMSEHVRSTVSCLNDVGLQQRAVNDLASIRYVETRMTGRDEEICKAKRAKC